MASVVNEALPLDEPTNKRAASAPPEINDEGLRLKRAASAPSETDDEELRLQREAADRCAEFIKLIEEWNLAYESMRILNQLDATGPGINAARLAADEKFGLLKKKLSETSLGPLPEKSIFNRETGRYEMSGDLNLSPHVHLFRQVVDAGIRSGHLKILKSHPSGLSIVPTDPDSDHAVWLLDCDTQSEKWLRQRLHLFCGAIPLSLSLVINTSGRWFPGYAIARLHDSVALPKDQQITHVYVEIEAASRLMRAVAVEGTTDMYA